jgi:arginase
MHCRIIGAPIQEGTDRRGCDMGPSSLRTAGLVEALVELGHSVTDMGQVVPTPKEELAHPNKALKALPAIAAWTAALADAAYQMGADAVPIFLGGDHSMSAGTVSGIARRAAELGKPLFVLWLDAHPDFHTLDTTTSGNLHGVPLAYASGLSGFEGYFPKLQAKVSPERICAIGIRSVDPAERVALAEAGVVVHDMRAIDEHGIAPLLRAFLERVAAEGACCMSASTSTSSTRRSHRPSAPRCLAGRPSARRIWSWKCCMTAAWSPASTWSS